MRTYLKSKIWKVFVADACLDYDGSISIPANLMRSAGIFPYEQVHVLDKNNGQRFITYAIESDSNSICVNGAAAKLVTIGDELIILTYSIGVYSAVSYHPTIIVGG